MAKYFIEDTTLKSMADTIRSLTGSTAPLTPSEMTAGVQEAKEDVDSAMDALETLGVEVPEGSDVGDLAGLVGEVEVGGDGAELARSIVDGTITEYVDEEITTCVEYGFYNQKALTRVEMPSCTKIGEYCFNGCSSLQTVKFPKITILDTDYALYNIALPVIDENIFPALTKITGDSVLSACKCTEIHLPGLVKITGKNAFSSCTKLTSVYLPNVTYVYSQTFSFCSTLRELYLPQAATIGERLCQSATVLSRVRLPKATRLNTMTFYDTALETLILDKSDTICTLSATNVFSDTPIANGTGYIYVPAALIDTYKSATNWSTYATQFRALEDYTVDGTITGELDESKI